jgi:glycosyltransferase involved in cell wall biosynthesis
MTMHDPLESSFVAPKQSLSVVVITKDEEDRIERLLKSVAFADEIIVVDSGSTDATVDIARYNRAQVVYREWTDYVDQKQYAMGLANCEWILNLDADEEISQESANEIRDAVQSSPAHVSGFSLPRISKYLNRWIRHGGWYPDRKIRLVRRGASKWIGDGLHEKLEVSGEVRDLRNPILHYVYRDISDQIATINRFSTIVAESNHKRRSGLYVLFGIVHSLGKFLECAVWKLGILDGIPGLIIAVNSSFYIFQKHAKAWERSLPNTSKNSSRN